MWNPIGLGQTAKVAWKLINKWKLPWDKIIIYGWQQKKSSSSDIIFAEKSMIQDMAFTWKIKKEN